MVKVLSTCVLSLAFQRKLVARQKTSSPRSSSNAAHANSLRPKLNDVTGLDNSIKNKEKN